MWESGQSVGHESGGPEGWCKEAKREKEPEGRRWELVVSHVKVMFRDGAFLEEIAWSNMVLILKGRRGYRGIGIVEVLWKV